jgi:hypothetical protein
MKKEDPKHEDCGCSGNSIVRSKGEYTIIVARNGFKIQEDLPYPIWGTLYLQNQSFDTAVRDFLPPGVTCVSSVVGENINLAYTQGANTDNISIFAIPGNLLSYPEMLSGLNNQFLKTELAYFCNNTQVGNLPLLTDQQNKKCQAQPLYIKKIGGLSNVQNELITPLSRHLPNNSVKDVIELSLRKQEIHPDTIWIHKFAYINMTEKNLLVFYWQIIINEFVNLNNKAFKIK